MFINFSKIEVNMLGSFSIDSINIKKREVRQYNT